MTIITHIAAFVAGGAVAVLGMSLLAMARMADDQQERSQRQYQD